MADVLGAAAAAAGLLETAARLVARIRKGYERQKNLTEVLDKHALEIENINAVVRTILDEDALHTALVASELTKLQAVGSKLVRCLKEMDPGRKGSARQLVHQLVHGTKEEETLADIMTSLDRAKIDLSMRVHVANVGLTRMVHETVLANVEVINRIDSLLTEVFGDDQGLRLAGMLKNTTLKEDNLASLSKAELASLGWGVGGETGSFDDLTEERMDRIIIGNTAQDSAIQLLGPVGKDLWENIRVQIEDNEASDQAVQIAYPTDFHTFTYILDHQERMASIAAT